MSDVHIILDEAAVLGPLPAIENAVGIGRGYGVRFQLYYQSLGQLRKCFPDGQEQTLLSNVTQVYFATNDNSTAEYVSNRLGEETIVLNSGGISHGNSWQTSSGPHPNSYGGSTNKSYNWQLQARRLLKPEEVCALPPNIAITFAPGVMPIRTSLIRYYQEKKTLARAAKGRNRKSSVLALLWKMVLCALLFCVAVLLTENFS